MADLIVPNANPDVVELPPAFGGDAGAPGTFHPGNIDYEGFGNNAALKRASDALKFGFDQGNTLNSLRQNPNPEHRAATHDRIVRERVDEGQRNFEQQLGTAMGELRSELRRVETALDEKAGLKSDPTWRNAVVGTFHDMDSDGARMAAIADMIERGDNASLAALIEAPLIVTKLKPEVHGQLKNRVLTRVDPQGLKLRNQILNAMTKVEAAGEASAGMFNKLRAGAHEGAWKERAQKAAARNLAANFGR